MSESSRLNDEIIDTGIANASLTDISMDRVYSEMSEICKMYEDMMYGGEFSSILDRFMISQCHQMQCS